MFVKKMLWIVGALLAPLHSLLSPAATAAEAIKVGVIVPLSGEMAAHGAEVERSMRLALKERAGKTQHSYQLIFEDNQLNSVKSVSAARKLLEIDKVSAVVTLWPPTALVVAPLTDQANVLHYTVAWDPEIARTHRFVLSHQDIVITH